MAAAIDAPTAAFWDARYAADEYAYGTEPNAWLARQAGRLPDRGAALVPASGEGRDAVWLASRGLDVTAVDLSVEGLAKTRRLADARGVCGDAVHADLRSWDWPVGAYDVAALSFVHVDPSFRASMHARVVDALRPGGLVIIEGFHVGQLVYRTLHGSGGPSRADVLFTADLLRDDFGAAEGLSLAELETPLHEGAFHSGLARVVRGVFRKR